MRTMTKKQFNDALDEDTLNNNINNLELMTVSEHNCHHSSERKRNKDGKFSI